MRPGLTLFSRKEQIAALSAASTDATEAYAAMWEAGASALAALPPDHFKDLDLDETEMSDALAALNNRYTINKTYTSGSIRDGDEEGNKTQHYKQRSRGKGGHTQKVTTLFKNTQKGQVKQGDIWCARPRDFCYDLTFLPASRASMYQKLAM
jgi:hypothetical protein